MNELRAALENADGAILVFAGSDDALLVETLRRLQEGVEK